jgi:hypothetical protein
MVFPTPLDPISTPTRLRDTEVLGVTGAEAQTCFTGIKAETAPYHTNDAPTCVLDIAAYPITMTGTTRSSTTPRHALTEVTTRALGSAASMPRWNRLNNGNGLDAHNN